MELRISEISETIDFVFKWFALERKRPKVRIKKCTKRFWNMLYEVEKAVETALEESGERYEDPLDKAEWNNTRGCVVSIDFFLLNLELERKGCIVLPDAYRRFLNNIKHFDYVMLLNKSELPNPNYYWHVTIHESLHLVEKVACKDLIRHREKRGEPVELDDILYDIFYRKYPFFD